MAQAKKAVYVQLDLFGDLADKLTAPLRPKTSAGLLMYRVRQGAIEIFLCHPGGPWYANRDNGAWTIPKGEVEEGEDLFAAANREFLEETSIEPGKGRYHSLGCVRQRDGKIVHAWAFRKNADLRDGVKSNTFHMEYPAGSGQLNEYPEIDDGRYFAVDEARVKAHWSQVPFIDRLLAALGVETPDNEPTATE